jgi:hypothetical protein
MLLASSGIACGGLNYLHQRQHIQQAQEWAAALQANAARSGSVPATPMPIPLSGRDDGSCLICQTLHAPLMAQAAPPPILAFVLLMLLVMPRPPRVVRARISLHIDPRGPPII